MAKICTQCSHPNPPRARFCEICGGQVADASGDLPILNGVRLSIGRNLDNDLVLDFPMVSTRHAMLTIQGYRVRIQDLKSTNGLFLNDPANRITESEIRSEDQIYFGSYRVSAGRLLRQAKFRHKRDSAIVPVEGGDIVIGRDPETTITLQHPRLSRKHTRIFREADALYIEDLGSTNGTFVNGERLKKVRRLRSADQIMTGPFVYVVEGLALRKQSAWDDFLLDIRGVSVIANEEDPAKRKVILDNVSVVVFPGELCGIMGVAGAGKSTLMKTANGYRLPSLGAVYINRLNMHKHYHVFRYAIGYVPQEDIFHKDLTVAQALHYACRLRLGRTLGRQQIKERAHQVLSRLSMFEANAEIAETRISDISGGQKRRLNIAIELLTDPAIFFLDEPTSGLSSEDALIVMKLLKSMAAEGKTILLTLHQPNREIYESMDNVVYLHKGGKLVYYGPTVPDSLTFTNPDLPLEHAVNHPEGVLRAIDAQPASFWKKKYRDSPYPQEFIASRQKPPIDIPPHKPPGQSGWIDGLYQWSVCHARNFRVRLQDRMNSSILLLQAPLIAALIALAFSAHDPDQAYQHSAKLVYLMVIAAMWFGCSNAARDICGEWPLYQRERMFNLRIPAYVLAKLTVGGLICLIQCAILVAIVHESCNLYAPWHYLVIILWFTAMAGTSLGLLISAFAAPFKKNNEIAIGIVPIVLLPMVILGGVIKPHKDMTVATRAVAALTVTRWAFESTLVLEAEPQVDYVAVYTEDGREGKTKRDVVLDAFFEPHAISGARFGVGVIFLMCLAFTAATMVLLRNKDLI